MYRIRLYIVPEQQEELPDGQFDDHWWRTADSRVSVLHKTKRGNVITVGGEMPSKKDIVKKERRNTRWKEIKTNRQEVKILFLFLSFIPEIQQKN